MKLFLRSTLAVLFVTLMPAASGHASPFPCGPIRQFLGLCGDKPKSSDVPEINPELAAGALALIGGAVVVIRGRRKA
jgi:hypothetical protein